jgi:hypothetical protein
VGDDEVLAAGLADDPPEPYRSMFAPTVCHMFWNTAVEPVK